MVEEQAQNSADATPEIVQKAEKAAAALKAENDRAEALAKRLEAANARDALAGKSTAGQPQTQKEETPKEYKDRIMRGGK